MLCVGAPGLQGSLLECLPLFDLRPLLPFPCCRRSVWWERWTVVVRPGAGDRGQGPRVPAFSSAVGMGRYLQRWAHWWVTKRDSLISLEGPSPRSHGGYHVRPPPAQHLQHDHLPPQLLPLHRVLTAGAYPVRHYSAPARGPAPAPPRRLHGDGPTLLRLEASSKPSVPRIFARAGAPQHREDAVRRGRTRSRFFSF